MLEGVRVHQDGCNFILYGWHHCVSGNYLTTASVYHSAGHSNFGTFAWNKGNCVAGYVAGRGVPLSS